MKKTLLLCLFCLSVSLAFAQSPADSIEVKKGFSTVYRQNGANLTPKQLLDITQSNPAAYKEMKIAKGKADVVNVLGFAGGALVGYPLGSAIGGGKPNWSLAGIGAGLIALSLPFTSSYTKHANNAVRIHNGGSPQTGLKTTEFKVGLAGNGLGMNLKF